MSFDILSESWNSRKNCRSEGRGISLIRPVNPEFLWYIYVVLQLLFNDQTYLSPYHLKLSL